MVEKIKFRDPSNEDQANRSPVTYYQFTVVNNPQQTQYFENHQHRDMSTDDDVPLIQINSEDPSSTNISANTNNITTVDIIFAPHYIYSYIRANASFKHPVRNVVRPKTCLRANPISDNENLALSKLQKVGIDIIYTNQYAAYLSDHGMDATYYESDHTTEIASFMWEGHESWNSLWRNLPWHAETTVQVSTRQDLELFSIAPYVTRLRHNIESTPLHKFDQWRLRAGDVVDSTIFGDSTESLLHVALGKVLINGMEVSRYEFYEHDATTSVKIEAIEDSMVVQTSKVPSIDFTGLVNS